MSGRRNIGGVSVHFSDCFAFPVFEPVSKDARFFLLDEELELPIAPVPPWHHCGEIYRSTRAISWVSNVTGLVAYARTSVDRSSEGLWAG